MGGYYIKKIIVITSPTSNYCSDILLPLKILFTSQSRPGMQRRLKEYFKGVISAGVEEWSNYDVPCILNKELICCGILFFLNAHATLLKRTLCPYKFSENSFLFIFYFRVKNWVSRIFWIHWCLSRCLASEKLTEK